MIALTLGNATAFVIALLGTMLVFNGFRGAFIDEVTVGGLLLAAAYAVTQIGPVI
jgi:hypothetical protein